MISLPRLVRRQTPAIPRTPRARASPSLVATLEMRWPRSFWRSTLAVKTKVRVTQSRRARLAGPDWGEADMRVRSFRQSSRQLENRGSRQPLKTCATRIT